jgi:hypothetical protein
MNFYKLNDDGNLIKDNYTFLLPSRAIVPKISISFEQYGETMEKIYPESVRKRLNQLIINNWKSRT